MAARKGNVSARSSGRAGRSVPPFYTIVELRFDSSESMEAALTSPAGQVVASGLSAFASGGATVLFCESGCEALSVLPGASGQGGETCGDAQALPSQAHS